MTKPKEKKAERRRRRVSLGGPRRRLAYDNQDPGYHYRWINDKDRRLADAQEGGYEFVEREEGDPGNEDLAHQDDGLGSNVSKVVTDRGQRAFLMRIKKEWFEEDQAEKQKIPDAIEEQIRTRHDEFAQQLGDSVRGKVRIE